MWHAPKKESDGGGGIEAWFVCLAGALLLFAIAAVTLTLQTPHWPMVLFGKAVPVATSQSEPEAPVDMRMTYSINTLPVFADGKTEGNVEIFCDVENLNGMQVRFLRKDTGEQIYTSQALEPGDVVRSAKLGVLLPAGEYACSAEIDVLNADGGVEDTLIVDINLLVQA